MVGVHHVRKHSLTLYDEGVAPYCRTLLTIFVYLCSFFLRSSYQLTQLDHEQQNVLLGGPIALLKAQSTVTFEFCAREAAQIFGGLSYTRGGQGEKVERLYREVRAYAIPAGSEEIMLDRKENISNTLGTCAIYIECGYQSLIVHSDFIILFLFSFFLVGIRQAIKNTPKFSAKL